MANSDYTTRPNVSGFCPHAVLASSIGQLQTSITMSGYTSPIENGIRIGMAAMIGSEIVSIDARADNVLTIGRGCCDTIPQAHPVGTSIWFFDDSIGNDNTEFVAGETIGVKVLPRTATGGAVPVSASPPQAVTFNRRFARPYPPGNVRVDGQPWFEPFAMSPSGATSLTLTWAHRDRITQADQLIPHGAGNVGPETGVTYTLVVRRASDNANLRTVTGITGTSWTYNSTMLAADIGTGITTNITIALYSQRGSLLSLMPYSIAVAAESAQTFDPNYANRSLIMLTTGTEGSISFVDSGPLNNTIHRGGSTRHSTAQKLFGATSAFFDGSGDWLRVDDRNEFDFSGDFCIEMAVFQVQRSVVGAAAGLIQKRLLDTSAAGTWGLGIENDGSLRWGNWQAVTAQTAGLVPLNQWCRIAVSRQGSTMRMFVDGIQVLSWTDTTNYTSGYPVYFGFDRAANGTAEGNFTDFFHGYMTQVRVTKGLPVRTENYTLDPLPFPNQ